MNFILTSTRLWKRYYFNDICPLSLLLTQVEIPFWAHLALPGLGARSQALFRFDSCGSQSSGGQWAAQDLFFSWWWQKLKDMVQLHQPLLTSLWRKQVTWPYAKSRGMGIYSSHMELERWEWIYAEQWSNWPQMICIKSLLYCCLLHGGLNTLVNQMRLEVQGGTCSPC